MSANATNILQSHKAWRWKGICVNPYSFCQFSTFHVSVFFLWFSVVLSEGRHFFNYTKA